MERVLMAWECIRREPLGAQARCGKTHYLRILAEQHSRDLRARTRDYSDHWEIRRRDG